MILTRSRHRLLLALTDADRPLYLHELAGAIGRTPGGIHRSVQRLREAGLIEAPPKDIHGRYRLRRGAAVSRTKPWAGFVLPLESGGS